MDLRESQEGTTSEAGEEIGRSEDRETGREDANKRVTLGGDAPKYVSLDETILGADRAAAHVPRARNFTVENKFSPEGSLADSHRLSSPAIQRPTCDFLKEVATTGAGSEYNDGSGQHHN